MCYNIVSVCCRHYIFVKNKKFHKFRRKNNGKQVLLSLLRG